MSGDEVVAATRETYDEIAELYAARIDSNDEARDWLTELTADFPDQTARILDVGCGPGHDAAELTRRGHDVLGLDLSTSMLRLARAAGVHVVQGDLRRLPLTGDAVDVVWSSASLLHVPREQTAATLAEWRRVVRAGGRLALSTSSGDDEGWEVVPYAVTDPTAEVGRSRWFVHRTRDELVAALVSAGWQVEHVGERQSHRRWHLIRARAD